MKWILILLLVGIAVGHGDHGTNSNKPNHLNWEQWHMIEEHGLDVYDADTIFKLHDLSDNGEWSHRDVLNLYGLLRELIVGDGSGMGEHDHSHEQFTQQDKDKVISTVFGMIDSNKDGIISLQEFKDFKQLGNSLPDLGYGQGHHLDFESEYEEHHWLKYHQNEDPDVLIKHKEDIEHELLHHEHEIDLSHDDNLQLRQTFNHHLSNIRLYNLAPKYLNA